MLKTVEAELELKSVSLWNVCPCPPLHCTQFILPFKAMLVCQVTLSVSLE